MSLDLTTLITILGMAVVTYATRIAGLWFVRSPSQRMTAWLSHIPGAVMVSIVAPAVLDDGPAGVVAALATTIVAIRSSNLVLSMLTGVVTIWLLRNF
jgi:uncharacterized membrane protein